MNLIKQSFFLILGLAAVGLVVYTDLSAYLAEIVGFLIVCGILFTISKKDQNVSKIFSDSSLFVSVAVGGTLLVIFLTGGIASNLFFLVYLLLFAIPFIFESWLVFVLLIGVLALFAPQAMDNDPLLNIVKLASLVILSPLAFFFGNQFKQTEIPDQNLKSQPVKKQNPQNPTKKASPPE